MNNLETMSNAELEKLNDISGDILMRREETRRAEVEKQASSGMNGVYNLLKEEFISSSQETEQFRIFYRKFRSAIKKSLKDKIKKMEIYKNHFDISGFFETLTGKIYYFSLDDVRWDKGDRMLIRTAKHFKDYTGGSNDWISISNFDNEIESYLN